MKIMRECFNPAAGSDSLIGEYLIEGFREGRDQGINGYLVHNVPEYADQYNYIVARYIPDKDELWFWGAWKDEKPALEAARDIDGQVIYRNGYYNDHNIANDYPSEETDESLNEDTVKQGKKWVNKGEEGTHGKFNTKKEADAQRKAMFANGYKEGLEEAKKEEDELPPDPEAVKLEVHNNLNNLVASEISTIDEYDQAKADILDAPIEHKDELISTIDHIKDEEKEHIDELINATSNIPFSSEAKTFDERKEEVKPTDIIPEEEQAAIESGEVVEEDEWEDEVEESLTEDKTIDYVDYKHSYCHELEPKMKQLNYMCNVLKVPVGDVIKKVLGILKSAKNINKTEKEQWFYDTIKNKKWNNAAEIYQFIKNSIKKAKEVEATVDDEGELKKESLNEDWEGNIAKADELLDKLIAETDNEDYYDADGYWSGDGEWCYRYLYQVSEFNNKEKLEQLIDEYSKEIPGVTFYSVDPELSDDYDFDDPDFDEDEIDWDDELPGEIGYTISEDEVEESLTEDAELIKARVADVEYNDDDGYDRHVLIYLGNEDKTEEEIEDDLTEEGMIYVFVNDIFEKEIPAKNYDLYDVIESYDVPEGEGVSYTIGGEDYDEDDDEWEDEDELTEYLVKGLQEHINDRPEPIEDKSEFKGQDNAVVDCPVSKLITHSEDEKPLDCKMEKSALKKPLAGDEVKN